MAKLTFADGEWERANALAIEVQNKIIEAANDSHKIADIKENYRGRVSFGPNDEIFLNKFSKKSRTGNPKLQHSFIIFPKKDKPPSVYALGRQEEKTLLGEGNFGRVIIGQDRGGKACAIKIIKTTTYTEDEWKDINNEIEAGKAMGYLLDSVIVGDTVYLVMPLLKGNALFSLSAQSKIPLTWAEIAEGINFDQETMATATQSEIPIDLFDPFERERKLLNSIGFTDEEINRLLTEKTRLLQEEKYKYSDEDKLKTAIAAAKEIKKIFDLGWLHCDIKGENCIGYMDAKDKADVYLTDYGLAIKQDYAAIYTSFRGTPNYMAPEVKEKFNANRPYYKADVALSNALKTIAPDKESDEELRATLKNVIKNPEANETYKAAKKAYDRFLTAQKEYNAIKAKFSTASDVYSFAAMCVYDFDLTRDSGYGIIKRCLRKKPKDRPSIEEVIRRLELELNIKNAKTHEEKLKYLLPYLNTHGTDFKSLNVFSFAAMCSVDFELPHDIGFDIIVQCEEEDAEKPSTEEVISKVRLDLNIRNIRNAKTSDEKVKDLLPYLNAHADDFESLDAQSFTETCISDFKLPDDIGFGIIKQYQELKPGEELPIEELISKVRLDLNIRHAKNHVEILKHLLPYLNTYGGDFVSRAAYSLDWMPISDFKPTDIDISINKQYKELDPGKELPIEKVIRRVRLDLNIQHVKSLDEKSKFLLPYLNTHGDDFENLDAQSFAWMCLSDFGLPGDIGFGIIVPCLFEKQFEDRPPIEEVIRKVRLDLNIRHAKNHVEILEYLLPYLDANPNDFEISDVHSFATMCISKFGLTENSGLGIIGKCLDKELEVKPSKDEVIGDLKSVLNAHEAFNSDAFSKPIKLKGEEGSLDLDKEVNLSSINLKFFGKRKRITLRGYIADTLEKDETKADKIIIAITELDRGALELALNIDSDKIHFDGNIGKEILKQIIQPPAGTPDTQIVSPSADPK